MQIVVLPAARDDMREIWLFGVLTWGEGQADRYADMIDAGIRGLGAQPYMRQGAEGVSPGLRRLIVGWHVVFHRVGDEAVRIIRVLHQSRDAGLWVG
jgi:toxin ParE1/3/4